MSKNEMKQTKPSYLSYPPILEKKSQSLIKKRKKGVSDRKTQAAVTRATRAVALKFVKRFNTFDKKTKTSFQILLINYDNKIANDETEVVVDPLRDSFLSERNTIRGMLGMQTYRFDLGYYSVVSTSAGGSPSFSTIGQAYINMSLTNTTMPSFTSYQSLFDEHKVAGVSVHWTPYNRDNHGAATNCGPWAIYFDDEGSNIAATTSAAGFGNLVDWSEIHHFSPDQSWKRTFRRPSRLDDYSWVPTAGTPPTTGGTGTAGCLALAMDTALNTVSTIYGTITYIVHVDFKMRI